MTPHSVRTFALSQLRADGILVTDAALADFYERFIDATFLKFRLQLPGSEIIPTSAVSGATRDDVDKKR